jgi:hypothetical protein
MLPKEDLFSTYSHVNRLIIIGNGFDLAHGIHSSFTDFIYHYADQVIKSIYPNLSYEDQLLEIHINGVFENNEHQVQEFKPIQSFSRLVEFKQKKRRYTHLKLSDLLHAIIKDVESKNWVDIENIYFDQLKDISNNLTKIQQLNAEFEFLKLKFLEYLSNEIAKHNWETSEEIFKQFTSDVKVEETIPNTLKKNYKPSITYILDFNYTPNISKYTEKFNNNFKHIQIHGALDGDNIFKQKPIFGYGDEMNEDYRKFENKNLDELFEHIKSFKYLHSDNYRQIIEFINSSPYQIHIYGHSCGLSDRTLLNTLFENENCISIKPYYFIKDHHDDYEKKTFAISRHFNSKLSFRNKVTIKGFCEEMFQPLI